MKKLIPMALSAIFGIVAVTAFSSSISQQQSVITVKPAIPKVTITKAFRQFYNIQDDVEAFIRANVRQGYIVKAVAIAEDNGSQRAIVVMEKY